MSIGKLVHVVINGGSTLTVEWDDGRISSVDLTSLIASRPNLARLADPVEFEQAALSSDGWSVEWPCGIDLGAQQLRRWS